MTISFGSDPPSVYRRYILMKCLPISLLSLPHAAQRIDTLLMSPKEALIQAATTGQTKWLMKLMEGYTMNVCDVIVAAGECGLLEAVKLLSESLGPPANQKSVMWKVMEAAARNGHLDVVEFAAEHVKEVLTHMWGSHLIPASPMSNALAFAVTGGHAEVVKFLADPRKFMWDFGEALDQAVVLEKQEIIDLLLQVCSQNAWVFESETSGVLNLVTRGGRKNAVKYLYEHGHDSTDVVDRAFLTAAKNENTEMMQFFLDVGTVSRRSFNQAFRTALSRRLVASARFLNSKKRATAKTIAKIFKEAASDNNISFVKFLCDEGYAPGVEIVAAFEFGVNHNRYKLVDELRLFVSVEFITKGFKNAASIGYKDVVEILYKAQPIPPEVVTEAFMGAVHNKNDAVVRFLRDDAGISSDTFTEAFVYAAEVGRTAMLSLLVSKQNTCPEVLGRLLKNAASRGFLTVVKHLIGRRGVSLVAKNEALVEATRCNQDKVVAFMQELLKK